MRPPVKRLFGILLVLLLAAAGVAGIRWFGGRAKTHGASEAGSATQEKQTRYHCPMHPAMISDKPGDCPICGMRMVPLDSGAPAQPGSELAPSTQPEAKKILYRSTMNPNEVSDRPGKDSMGMEMERVEMDETTPASGSVQGLAAVRIPLRKQQLIGVRTETVTRAPFIRELQTVGRVTVDETRIHHVHTKVEGWVDQLFVNATGEKVRMGRPLLSIYSPELLATQGEHLLALKARRELGEGVSLDALRRADELVESSRRRLLLYDFEPRQVDEIERTGAATRAVTLYAPISGYILQRNVTQGQKITPELNLLDIADLSRVWVLASIYEYELPFVKVGQSATMSLAYQPGKSYEGKVTLIYPVLEGNSRTVQARLEFPNPDMDLMPEMFANVTIRADMGKRLAISEGAVISTGTRDIVFVARGEGSFEPREVRLGLRLPERVEILDGLREGDSIVSSGNFLIDSESKLKSALEAAAAAPSAQTQTAPSGGRR